MTAAASARSPAAAHGRLMGARTRWLASTALVEPAALFAAALAVRAWAASLLSFPLTEGSAYYVAVARNLVAGRGFEIDAIWSYATPPLVLPRPAFELWQPLASVIAAAGMLVGGRTFDGAQFAFAVLGALLAPLAWLIARDAADRAGLDARRAAAVRLGAGVLVAVCGPLVLSSVVPDSTLPFAVFAVASCVVVPHAVRGRRRAVVALGVLLGLAYLARMEAIYVGVAFVVLGLAARDPGVGLRSVLGRAGGVALAAAAVATPWWLRNAAVFGTPLPAQLTDNMFLTRNEQVYAYADQPTLDGFLAQGFPAMLSNIGAALSHNLFNVLLVPGGVVVALGIVAVAVSATAGAWRHDRYVVSPVAALLISGVITYIATSVLFPVATLWGTFEHAAGPLLLALIVSAVLAADAVVARVRAWRGWRRSNAWLASVSLVALTLPIVALQVAGASRQAFANQAAFAALVRDLPAALTGAGVDPATAVVTDRPVWLSDALDRPAIALPDEPVVDVLALARQFGAQAVVVVEARGRHPDALGAHTDCLARIHASPPLAARAAFVIDENCR